MNKLSKQKRDQLILVILVTGLGISGIWFGLISFQNSHLQDLSDRTAAVRHNLDKIDQAVKHAEQVETDLAAAGKTLLELEEDMAAAGDLSGWMVTTIRKFKLPYKVEIPQYSSAEPTDRLNFLPRFPYKLATLRIGGTAYFHDFGKFLADFENTFPQFRVLNLELEPAPSSSTTTEKERLSFQMDIVALIKPNT